MEGAPLLEGQKPPGLVKAVPRFLANVDVMIQLMEAEDSAGDGWTVPG
jgi:hypothetical protein